VGARALPAQGNPAADTCIIDNLQSQDSAVRAAAATSLRLLIGTNRIAPARSWPLAQSLARDADPRVRAEAIPAVAMFDFKHAIDILTGMGEKDGDAAVVAVAQSTTQTLRNYRFMHPDGTY
jgi:HEAT repeat protein